MSFQHNKIRQLKMQDNSSIGKLDRKIEKLCNKLNKKKEYYTTSSCAGRIIIIKNQEKKQKGLFILRIHDKIKLSDLRKALKTKEDADFRQEPCILHVACRDIESASKLLEKAIHAGWKRSGMISAGKRFILEMMSTEHLDVPIIRNNKLLVDENYLKMLVKEANLKLERSWNKIKNLEKAI
jgi:tRNA wybutosine-synthesizing protein 3